MHRNSKVGRSWCRARSDSLHELQNLEVWRAVSDLTMQALIE